MTSAMTIPTYMPFYNGSPIIASDDNETMTCETLFSSSPTTTISSPSSFVSPSSMSMSMSMSIPSPHPQLFLPHQEEIVEYTHLKCPVDVDDDDNAVDLDDDYFHHDSSSSCCRSDRRYQQRWNGSSGSIHTDNKVSLVKKRGGGSWLLGFARLHQHSQEETEALPGLVRSNSNSSLGSSSTSSSSSSSSNKPTSSNATTKKGVTFNTSVLIRPIPHSSTYTSLQRKKMYATSQEVRTNKIRNKKEYRYDGYDWRNATEEWEMSVCMLTGELVHPAHTLDMK